MIQSEPLLLEIGVEELPASFVDAALAALPGLVTTKLAELRLAHGEIKALGTPRRLAALVLGVATRQPDLDEEVIGPPETAAFKDGKPTKAAEAFAAKLGVSLDALTVDSRSGGAAKKPGRYLIGRRVEAGLPATELLGKGLTDVCASIPFRKSMRWGEGDAAAFGRPVQWLVALLGEHVIDTSFAGVRSGRTTRGHRFLAAAPFDLASPAEYVAKLRAHHVLVDRDERARVMMERVAEAARAAGGAHDPEPMLVDENASLVEEPHVVTGAFEPGFLALPAAVIRSVARGHQKYFCVHREGDELVPRYLAVVNTANRPELIAKGNDRVMRARLADAMFFFEEDKKVSLESRVEKLSGIVFHHRLGTVREKVSRVERLSAKIAELLGLPAEARAQAARAAHLCKFDLVSLMVGEFPELQGAMGRAYAKHAGESDVVADAIRDHYRPASASDDVAPGDVAAVVALADRIDTLTGCFAVGLSPTGAADPFALRRACIGVLRTLLDKAERSPPYATLPLGQLVFEAYGAFEGKKLDLSREDTVRKVMDFAVERLRGILTTTASGSVADAILSGVGDAAVNSPYYTLVRARAVQGLVDGRVAWLGKAKQVAKRLSGISKEAHPKFHPESAFAGSKKDDAAIVKLVSDVHEHTRELTGEAEVRAALAAFEALAVRLDEIFAATLINDPDDPRTRERLELLSFGARCMLHLADFSKLAG